MTREHTGESAQVVSRKTATVTVSLLLTLALQSAVPPFATDMYTPAFPLVTDELTTTASAVGLTMTAFFIGMAAGQFLGGPLSDRFGRRWPLIIGGVLCMVGAIVCAIAPTIGILSAARVVQGIGGGIAAAVARAILVDRARGDQLARLMSILIALGGLAPMIAPVAGGAVLTVGGTWRTVFWCLSVFGALMVITAAVVVRESLPREQRTTGGLGKVLGGFQPLLYNRVFVFYTVTSAFAGFALIAYVANSSYVLQEMKGMAPLAFALFFASTALVQVALSFVNARLIGRYRPRALIGAGLSTAAAAVIILAVSILLLDIPLVLTCAGFLILMGSQAFVFGNTSAEASAEARHSAGSGSALLGVTQSTAMALSAPLASLGGAETAVPMLIVLIIGVGGAIAGYFLARPTTAR